jgi:hypothetical protein
LGNNVKEFIESKKLELNIQKELGTNFLKQLQVELNGKNTNEKLCLTVKNTQKDENVQRSYKLVHSYPFNDNFKVKVNYYSRKFIYYLDHFC